MSTAPQSPACFWGPWAPHAVSLNPHLHPHATPTPHAPCFTCSCSKDLRLTLLLGPLELSCLLVQTARPNSQQLQLFCQKLLEDTALCP